MNIALIGHGNMGKEVERAAAERKIHVARIFTIENNLRAMGLTAEALREVDVCIDFSAPTAALENIRAVAECRKNMVVGTTGWYDQLKEIEKIVRDKKIGLLYSANFSLGMNIFSQILASAAHYFEKFECYDIAIHETHHRGKADSPSGTALMLGQILLQNIRRKRAMMHETAHQTLSPEQLHITSTRVGSAFGVHRVLFDSEADSIEFVHTAKNRTGFALGALVAAEWLKGKKGIFTMKDIFTSP